MSCILKLTANLWKAGLVIQLMPMKLALKFHANLYYYSYRCAKWPYVGINQVENKAFSFSFLVCTTVMHSIITKYSIWKWYIGKFLQKTAAADTIRKC